MSTLGSTMVPTDYKGLLSTIVPLLLVCFLIVAGIASLIVYVSRENIPQNILPTASFTYSPTSPTTENTVQFINQSTVNDGAIVSWYWDFGDEMTSTIQNPTHKYTNPGTYPVSLTVTDNWGASETGNMSITVQGGLGDGLEIFCIERRPNYPRYNPVYTSCTVYDDYLPYDILYSTGLGLGQDNNTQRHPNEGDVVQYVAHIYNMSENVFDGEISYQWYLDDGLIRENTWIGTIALHEKAEISLSLT
jgi:hypothetical protein